MARWAKNIDLGASSFASRSVFAFTGSHSGQCQAYDGTQLKTCDEKLNKHPTNVKDKTTWPGWVTDGNEERTRA